MEDKKILLDNIAKIHTTEMGVDRIKRNLKIDTVDVVEYCKNKKMCIRDRGDTVKPRLMEADADLDRVLVIDEGKQELSLRCV